MNLNDVTPDNYFKKVTYSADPDPGNKIIVSNGLFIQCAIHLSLIAEIQKLRTALIK